MFYKLIVNAAFLAIGYYIGKEVCRGELVRKGLVAPRESAAKSTAGTPSDHSNKSSN